MIQWRNRILLTIIGLYLIFNYGFMLLRIPPTVGQGVPIGEIILIITLLTIHYGKLFAQLSSIIILWPFLCWWGFGIVHALFDARTHGMWALRDATQVIESLYLLSGFVVAHHVIGLRQCYKWLPKLIILIVVYGLTYPFASTLTEFSPKIISGAGHSIPLFFNYTNTAMMLMMAAMWLLLFKTSTIKQGPYLILAILLLGFPILLFQSRIIYLQIIGLMIFFMFYKQQITYKLLLMLLASAISLIILLLFDWKITGRLGQVISAEFIMRHIQAIAGIASPGLEGAAHGVSQRFDWWLNTYQQVTANAISLFTGLGYGVPLTNFYVATDVVVREPHNSYISIIGRLGIIGFTLWLWMHIALIVVWQRCYRLCQRLNWSQGKNHLLLVMSYFILLWIFCLAEDGFEKPYNTIPYYFFWGIILGFYYNLKNLTLTIDSNKMIRFDQ